ncbi:hypothetical protein C8Q74DRAFT_1218487 [Fomes fomentarius]|nr:hypothetical protein C8Q74DRAFT_1218487 [Fomes fomentarius]
MSTFSKVIARPTPVNGEQKKGGSTLSSPKAAPPSHGLWIFDTAPVLNQKSGRSNAYAHIFGIPLLWQDRGTYRVQASSCNPAQPENVTHYFSPSPPLGASSTESSNGVSFSSSPTLSSPPTTAYSTIAVLGSAALDHTFEDDYDRPEANADFIRSYLRRSSSLRRLTRYRYGDYRNTDDELDYSVSTERIVDVPHVPDNINQPFLTEASRAFIAEGAPGNTARVGDDVRVKPHIARATMTPSRLSQRVRPPPPIDTRKKTLRNGIRYEPSRGKYEIEGGYVEPSVDSESESGFDADDEDDTLKRFDAAIQNPFAPQSQTKQPLPPVVAHKPDVPTGSKLPGKKSYAAVLASSAPRASGPRSRAVSMHTLQPKQREPRNAHVWKAFVEPMDV